MILHVANARVEHFKIFLVLSNDSDVVIYFSAYFDKFKTKNVKKIGVKYGLKERQWSIPIHRLADILDSGKSRHEHCCKLIFQLVVVLRARLDPNYHSSKQNQKILYD